MSNGDLAKFNNEQLLDHLRNFGLTESRQFTPFFDINYYRNANQDSVKAGLNGKSLLEHFENYGLVEGRQFSHAFDIKYYRSIYFEGEMICRSKRF